MIKIFKKEHNIIFISILLILVLTKKDVKKIKIFKKEENIIFWYIYYCLESYD